MAQIVGCPGCNKDIRLPDTAAGKKVRCSGCDATCRIHENSEGDLFLEMLDDDVIIPDKPSMAPTPRGRGAAAPARGRAQAGRDSGRGRRDARGRAPSRGLRDRSIDGDSTVLILGILGLVTCPFLSPMAWIMGVSYTKSCRSARVTPSGAGTAGMFLGVIGTLMLLFYIVFSAKIAKMIMAYQ